jgi:hypothetical protein
MEAGALSHAENWLGQRRKELEAQLDRLENYLSTLQNDGDH